ncbi:hypothetical protein B7463_g12333, partial [Scytalidium lignicola]
MDTIYRHSELTIMEAAGDGPHHVLPGISATLRETQPSVKIGSSNLVYTPYVRNEIEHSKLGSRGWTYQEGLLSQKNLVFTDNQTHFQCNAMHCLENIYAPLESLHTSKIVRMRDKVEISRAFHLHGLGRKLEDLEDQLREYLGRSLTFESDILDAFKGVLAAFERKPSKPVKVSAESQSYAPIH